MLAVLKSSLLALSCAVLLGCVPPAAPGARPETMDVPAPAMSLWDVVAPTKAYLGDARGDYLFADGRVSHQLILAMGIPDRAERGASRFTTPSGDSLTLYAGCRQHSCSEKGAVVIDRDGRVVRAGLIHFCGSDGCLRNLQAPELTIFVRGNPRDADEAEKILVGWAEDKYPNIEIERRVLP